MTTSLKSCMIITNINLVNKFVEVLPYTHLIKNSKNLNNDFLNKHELDDGNKGINICIYRDLGLLEA